MRLTCHVRRVVPVCLAALIGFSSPAWAQTRHIADPTALAQAVQARLKTEAADRGVVQGALASPEAAAVAGRLGLDLKRAQAAVATMEGAELAQLAAVARTPTADRAAGATNTIVISTTTLLLILLVIVLLVK